MFFLSQVNYVLQFNCKREYDFSLSSCDFALGHSLGEYSALVAANAISFPDAIKLVVRSSLSYSL